MANIEFEDDAADQLEAAYLGADVVAQRQDTLAKLAISPGESILDIGSGPGFLAADMARATGASGHVVGIDISTQLVQRAAARATDAWLSYQVADATQLPFENNSFDVVVSTQVAEYVPDTQAFCAEVYRVLKPGGRGLILATDWQAVIWHSNFPDRMDRVLAAFAPHCADTILPRTLAAKLRHAGLIVPDVSYFPIINLDRYEGCYGEMIVPIIKSYVTAQGNISADELNAWEAEQFELNAQGAHFFSSGRFCFSIQKSA